MPDAASSTAIPAPVAFRQPKPLLRYLAFALACSGAFFTVQLERVSYGGAESAVLQRLCGGDAQHSDCRSVLLSSHGSIPLGGPGSTLKLPVATIGSMYFTFLAIWYLFIGPVTRERRHFHLIVLGVVVIGALLSVDYVRVMAVVLRQWCGGCLAVHAINGALLLVTVAAWPWGTKHALSLPHPGGRLLGATVAAGVFAALMQFGFATFFLSVGPAKRLAEAYERVTTEPAYVLWNYGRAPSIELPSDDRPPLYGDPDAPHTIVVFTDFTCPRCKILHGELEKLVTRYAGKVRIDYRNFPLDSACNPHPKWSRGGHRGACDAAQAFEAVRAASPADAGRFAALLFENQTGPSRSNSELLTAALGGARSIDLRDPAALERARADVELGASLGLNDVGTPVLYLDGRRYDGWQVTAAWDQLLSDATTRPDGAARP